MTRPLVNLTDRTADQMGWGGVRGGGGSEWELIKKNLLSKINPNRNSKSRTRDDTNLTQHCPLPTTYAVHTKKLHCNRW
jgi:hypothetical protein